MSQLLGAAALLGTVVLYQDDKRNCDEWFHGDDDYLFPEPIIDNTWVNDHITAGFASPWWPNTGGLMSGFDGVDGNQVIQAVLPYGEIFNNNGNCNGRFSFVGYTRDAYGSPIPGCTVRCFRTSTDELESKVTSDANGFYIATTPYSDAHYLTVHKTVGPDIAGASVDTLVPS